ncbi:HAMP domain-containing histidine kinase [Oscillospiraceae bacterium N12]|jgi:two-component system, sporulation sensor kinase D|uniref:histidine kinase n=1 Tax=Jilunia laotingensis TaxID=2763675 RepID=A0A926IQ43_9BACT|nr:HAMP domain-containing sensor histidine kinase [Jilunia laotingensis]MBC8593160.1 HAMP domain-containing histidine kinase [Jilunia laotingensis]
MQIIDIRRIKVILVITAVIIAVASLYVSHRLVKDLSMEERLRMEVWAEAMRAFSTADENMDLNLVLKVLNANNTIPVIVADTAGNIQTYRNIDIPAKDSVAYLNAELESFKEGGSVIRMDLSSGADYIDVYYKDSLMLMRLSVYPYVQLGVVLIFVLVAIFALLSSKKAEQNKVWVGLSKETAHQLGTPISSLMAWTELLRDEYPSDNLIPCMAEDVARLQMIANRFSKIGSAPEMEKVDLRILLKEVTEYMARRTSDKVKIQTKLPSDSVIILLNSSLFGWVIENLCKNAIDAMNGVGQIIITVTDSTNRWYIDVEDTGKGIIKSKHQTIFTPGYTTKKRGWGLGLSLARRIVEEYHSGRIYVKQSELNKGTVFRIELKK